LKTIAESALLMGMSVAISLRVYRGRRVFQVKTYSGKSDY